MFRLNSHQPMSYVFDIIKFISTYIRSKEDVIFAVLRKKYKIYPHVVYERTIRSLKCITEFYTVANTICIFINCK